MRRYMMKIAERLAQENGCGALITGESVAQVASQTLYAIGCTDVACELPVLRPVIGMDKNEIIAISRKIGTFETSILPYEDCCTVFTPRHPRTKPKLRDVLRAERDPGRGGPAGRCPLQGGDDVYLPGTMNHAGYETWR